MEIFGKVDTRSRVAILAGKDQRRIVNEVTRVSQDFGFRVVSPDDYDFAVAIACSHDKNIEQEQGWMQSQEMHSARLLELQLSIVDEDARQFGRYALCLVATDGSRPVVEERQISIGQDTTPDQLLDCLNWVASVYLPGDIDDFARKKAASGYLEKYMV